jgi:hypothetical protein
MGNGNPGETAHPADRSALEMARVRGNEDYWPGQRLEFGRLLDRQTGLLSTLLVTTDNLKYDRRI